MVDYLISVISILTKHINETKSKDTKTPDFWVWQKQDVKTSGTEKV